MNDCDAIKTPARDIMTPVRRPAVTTTPVTVLSSEMLRTGCDTAADDAYGNAAERSPVRGPACPIVGSARPHGKYTSSGIFRDIL